MGTLLPLVACSSPEVGGSDAMVVMAAGKVCSESTSTLARKGASSACWHSSVGFRPALFSQPHHHSGICPTCRDLISAEWVTARLDYEYFPSAHSDDVKEMIGVMGSSSLLSACVLLLCLSRYAVLPRGHTCLSLISNC